MRRIIPRRPSPAMVVAFIALMVALAPTAAALRGTNIVSSNDIINGAVKKEDAGRDSVGTNEAREDEDPGGGFTGAQIEEGTLETVPSAGALAQSGLVNGVTGGFVRGRGVRTSRKVGVGSYEVTFEREVRTCNYVGLVSGSDPGQVAVADHATDANVAVVKTFDGDGMPADRSFHLALTC